MPPSAPALTVSKTGSFDRRSTGRERVGGGLASSTSLRVPSGEADKDEAAGAEGPLLAISLAAKALEPRALSSSKSRMRFALSACSRITCG